MPKKSHGPGKLSKHEQGGISRLYPVKHNVLLPRAAAMEMTSGKTTF